MALRIHPSSHLGANEVAVAKTGLALATEVTRIADSPTGADGSRFPAGSALQSRATRVSVTDQLSLPRRSAARARPRFTESGARTAWQARSATRLLTSRAFTAAVLARLSATAVGTVGLLRVGTDAAAVTEIPGGRGCRHPG